MCQTCKHIAQKIYPNETDVMGLLTNEICLSGCCGNHIKITMNLLRGRAAREAGKVFVDNKWIKENNHIIPECYRYLEEFEILDKNDLAFGFCTNKKMGWGKIPDWLIGQMYSELNESFPNVIIRRRNVK